MKQLNFYPYYADLLQLGRKKTTLRVSSSRPFDVGDAVRITTGWNESTATIIRSGRIEAIYPRKIQDLTVEDLDGESPDCLSPDAARLVLSCIYREALSPGNEVWVVKFAYD